MSITGICYYHFQSMRTKAYFIVPFHDILNYRLFERHFNMTDLSNISNYYLVKAYFKLLPI